MGNSEAGWESDVDLVASEVGCGVDSSSSFETQGWKPGASHLDALSSNCLDVKRKGTLVSVQLTLKEPPGCDANSPSGRTLTSPVPRCFKSWCVAASAISSLDPT